MKTLKDFAEDINKCSKCGLCQSVCPVYKLTGNECAVSRGKFVMLNGVLKGDLSLNKNIEKYLDMCLKCGKCSDFCPSAIDVCQIFNTAKYECSNKTFHGKIQKFLQSEAIFGNFINFFKKLNSKSAVTISRANSRKLFYFKGCVNNIFPKSEKALKKILSYTDVELVERDFDCCGLPFLSSGNLERYERAKAHNLNLMKDFDAVLTDCASCESTLRQYYEDSAPIFTNLGELALKYGLKFRFKKPLKVTFHKPCHLKNDDFLKPLLASCENVEYIQAEDYDECCGLAGEFILKNPKFSKKIIEKKAKNMVNTGADIVITTCPACIAGLRLGLSKNKTKVMSLAEFLSKASIFSK